MGKTKFKVGDKVTIVKIVTDKTDPNYCHHIGFDIIGYKGTIRRISDGTVGVSFEEAHPQGAFYNTSEHRFYRSFHPSELSTKEYNILQILKEIDSL